MDVAGILLPLVGFFVGALVTWLVASARQQTAVAVLKNQLDAAEQQLAEHSRHTADQEQQLTEMRDRLLGSVAEIAALKEKEQSAKDKIAMLEAAKQELSKEFEILANRIFEQKSKRFSETSKQALDGALSPLREQLSDFKKKVEDVYHKEGKERASLITELGHLKQLHQQMSEETANLTNALKGDNKTQGNWGEVILERVLEESGLRKGREYETQVNLQADDGGRRNPDVIIRLPENKDIVIDAKVSLLAYERYFNSDDEAQKQQALKQHVASVREHISRLSIKEYQNLNGIRSLDFVFIFIPIEAAYMLAFEQDPRLFQDAFEKNIAIIGPTTLLATLRIIQNTWRYERQNKNAEDIARQAGALHDKFVGFVEDLNDIAKYLHKATDAHDNAVKKLSTGRGNLVSSTQRLEKLGAKAKKAIPDSVISQAADEDDE